MEKTIEFNQRRAWEIFEQYASGEFQEVADYSWNSARSFYAGSVDFVRGVRNITKYKAALQKEFGIW